MPFSLSGGEGWWKGPPCQVFVDGIGWKECSQIMRAATVCISGPDPVPQLPVSSSDAALFSGPWSCSQHASRSPSASVLPFPHRKRSPPPPHPASTLPSPQASTLSGATALAGGSCVHVLLLHGGSCLSHCLFPEVLVKS